MRIRFLMCVQHHTDGRRGRGPLAEFDPFAHDNYRTMLRSWIGAKSGRSQTALSRRIGVSRSTVAMVLAGERSIPLSAAGTWSEGLGLDRDERAYFSLLVRADSPLSLDLRRVANAQAAAIRKARAALKPSIRQARLLSTWYVPVILELARSSDFQLCAKWLRPRLWPEVPFDELEATCNELQQTGMVVMSGSTAKVDIRPIATERELSGELSRLGTEYHQTQLAHAGHALEQLPAERRHFGSLTVAVQADEIPALVQAIHRWQLEVIEPFREVAGGDSVVQVSVQVFERTNRQID